MYDLDQSNILFISNIYHFLWLDFLSPLCWLWDAGKWPLSVVIPLHGGIRTFWLYPTSGGTPTLTAIATHHSAFPCFSTYSALGFSELSFQNPWDEIIQRLHLSASGLTHLLHTSPSPIYAVGKDMVVFCFQLYIIVKVYVAILFY